MSCCTIPSLSQHLVCLERDDSAGFLFPRGISVPGSVRMGEGAT